MKSVTFDNGRGFALGFDEAAPSPFVTWQFTETENGQKDYYWGHYHSSGQTAEKDFAKRVADYKELFGVHERTDGHEQAEYYRYYSTQRPVDLGTFPKPPGNAPVEIINFDERRMVEGGTMAMSLLMELPIASNCNILLADKNGEMVVVECTPTQKRVRGAVTSDNGNIVCTVNSFISDEYAPYDDANGDDYDSAKRYKVVMDSFIDKITDDYLETTTRLLKGEYGFMCQYEDPNFQTVWSSIFNLKNLMVYRAEGDPRKKKFVTDSRLHDIKFGR